LETGTKLPPFEPGCLDETVARVAQAGLSCVEIWVEDPETDSDLLAGGPSAFARRLKDAGLRVHSIHARWGDAMDLSSPDPASRQAGMAAALEAARLIAAMGGGHVILHPGQKCSDEARADRAARCRAALREIVERAAGLNATFALENMHAGHFGDRAQDLLACVDGLDPGRMGFCFDSGHAHWSPEGVALGSAMRGRMFTVHLHDNNGSRDEHLLPFEGSIDWREVARALDAAGYAGPYMMESGLPSWDEVVARARGIAERLHSLRDAP
jgi:sugar phosphate isomerase/epimerase